MCASVYPATSLSCEVGEEGWEDGPCSGLYRLRIRGLGRQRSAVGGKDCERWRRYGSVRVIIHDREADRVVSTMTYDQIVFVLDAFASG